MPQQVPQAVKQKLQLAKDKLAESRSSFADRRQQYLLLVAAWRHFKEARTMLNEWIYAPSSPPNRNERATRISHIPIVNGRPHQTDYTTADLEMIYGWLENGRDGIDADELFRIGWHFDGLERTLQRKIEWDEMHIALIEDPQFE